MLFLSALGLQPLRPDASSLNAFGAPLSTAVTPPATSPINASATWLTQMSAQVHHALVEAEKLEKRVAAAAVARDGNWTTDGAHGDALLREVTFKPDQIDAGMRAFRRSLLLHELAMSCRLVVVIDDPDPTSRDASFLSVWQLDGKNEPATPSHANGGDGYRKLRVALAGLPWQKHDRAHADFARRYYEGRVDAGFYSTRWYWLPASNESQYWMSYEEFSNSSRPPAPPPPPPTSPPTTPLRFTPPSSPLREEAVWGESAAAAAPAADPTVDDDALLDASSGEAADTLVGAEGIDELADSSAEPRLVSSRNSTGEHVDFTHVEGGGALESVPAGIQQSPPVVGLQGLLCVKLIALFKPGGLERGRAALADTLMPTVLTLPGAIAATALHDEALQKLLWLVLVRVPQGGVAPNATGLVEASQRDPALSSLLSEPLVTEVYTDAAIYWPGSL